MPFGETLELLEAAPHKFADMAWSMGQRVRYFHSQRCSCQTKTFAGDYLSYADKSPPRDCPTCHGTGRVYYDYVDYQKMLVSQINNQKMRDRIGEGEIGDMLLTVPYHYFNKSNTPYTYDYNPIWDTIGEGDKIILLDVKQRIEDIIQRERDYRLRNVFVDSILDVRSFDKVFTEGVEFVLDDYNKIDFHDLPIKGKKLRLELDCSKSLKAIGGGYIRDKYGRWNYLTMIDSTGAEFALSFTESHNPNQVVHSEFVGFAETGQIAVGWVGLWGQVTAINGFVINLTGQFKFYLAANSQNTERIAVQYLIQPQYVVFRTWA